MEPSSDNMELEEIASNPDPAAAQLEELPEVLPTEPTSSITICSAQGNHLRKHIGTSVAILASLGALIVAVWYGYWSLRIQRWRAMSEFRDQCRDYQASGKHFFGPTACDEILKQAPTRPPIRLLRRASEQWAKENSEILAGLAPLLSIFAWRKIASTAIISFASSCFGILLSSMCLQIIAQIDTGKLKPKTFARKIVFLEIGDRNWIGDFAPFYPACYQTALEQPWLFTFRAIMLFLPWALFNVIVSWKIGRDDVVSLITFASTVSYFRQFRFRRLQTQYVASVVENPVDCKMLDEKLADSLRNQASTAQIKTTGLEHFQIHSRRKRGKSTERKPLV
ncbi:hypothetical protein EJ08DRAFT_702076 [Tothia fuscella]|uniref:Uncharacterized protein n=1 Tax=Tothia fuscella TaxID=1048955 RepID=A0A9P4NHH0_9PEZI|nr:hypothetical protein EJ08DRAFT_702076 [Tothia fuscella]